MAVRFTLIAENKPELFDEACALASEDLDSFTVTRGLVGYWQGQREASFKIEVVVLNNDHDYRQVEEYRVRMVVVAKKLKALLHQDCVLLTEEEIKGAELI